MIAIRRFCNRNFIEHVRTRGCFHRNNRLFSLEKLSEQGRKRESQQVCCYICI